MFVLAHLSDLHLALRPRLLELAGKRGLGYINWHRGRKYIHRRETLDAVTRDLKKVIAAGILVAMRRARRGRGCTDRRDFLVQSVEP